MIWEFVFGEKIPSPIIYLSFSVLKKIFGGFDYEYESSLNNGTLSHFISTM